MCENVEININFRPNFFLIETNPIYRLLKQRKVTNFNIVVKNCRAKLDQNKVFKQLSNSQLYSHNNKIKINSIKLFSFKEIVVKIHKLLCQ